MGFEGFVLAGPGGLGGWVEPAVPGTGALPVAVTGLGVALGDGGRLFAGVGGTSPSALTPGGFGWVTFWVCCVAFVFAAGVVGVVGVVFATG